MAWGLSVLVELLGAGLNPLLWGLMLVAVVLSKRFWFVLLSALAYAVCMGLVGVGSDLKTALTGVFGSEFRYLLIRLVAASLLGGLFWLVKQARIRRSEPTQGA